MHSVGRKGEGGEWGKGGMDSPECFGRNICILGAVLSLINGQNPTGEMECAGHWRTGEVDLFQRPRKCTYLRTQLHDLEDIGMRFLFVREFEELNGMDNRTFHIFCMRGPVIFDVILHLWMCQERAGQSSHFERVGCV